MLGGQPPQTPRKGLCVSHRGAKSRIFCRSGRILLAGVCPRGIYPRMTKDMDRRITASPNDYKETRPTTVRFGSAVPVGPHAEYRAGNNQESWGSVRRQARPGRHDGIPAWRHGSCPASCLRHSARPTVRWSASSETIAPWQPRWA